MGDGAKIPGRGTAAVTAKTPGGRAANFSRPVRAGAPGRRQQRPRRRRQRRRGRQTRRRRRGWWPWPWRPLRGRSFGPGVGPRTLVTPGERFAETPALPRVRGARSPQRRRRRLFRPPMELENLVANSVLVKARRGSCTSAPRPRRGAQTGPAQRSAWAAWRLRLLGPLPCPLGHRRGRGQHCTDSWRL